MRIGSRGWSWGCRFLRGQRPHASRRTHPTARTPGAGSRRAIAAPRSNMRRKGLVDLPHRRLTGVASCTEAVDTPCRRLARPFVSSSLPIHAWRPIIGDPESDERATPATLESRARPTVPCSGPSSTPAMEPAHAEGAARHRRPSAGDPTLRRPHAHARGDDAHTRETARHASSPHFELRERMPWEGDR